MSYIILFLLLGILGAGYLSLPADRLVLAMAMGLSYFVWGVVTHRKHLYRQIVLEYFFLALLGMSLLIFLGLRA